MRVRLSNVGIINNCDIEFVPGINLIIGSSGSGKSTLMRSLYNMVSNEFADSDISFGKNTMNISVDSGENHLEYTRSVKPKGEKCYYTVNGEQYVKLGRQPLPAVTESLKIGDLDVNGENINFNFNLQFSSPFLIMGSQSTLYNVLTYRSSFDISSINDYYAADIKNNASEVATTAKLKDRLEQNLSQLEDQAEKLSPIEKLYSDYMVYKHKNELVNELKELQDKTNTVNNITNKLNVIDNLLSHADKANSLILELKELNKYNSMRKDLRDIDGKIRNHKKVIYSLDSSMNNIQLVLSFDSTLNKMKQLKSINSNIEIIDGCIKSGKDILSNDKFILDVVKQMSLAVSYDRCSRITEILNKTDSSIITKIDDLMFVKGKLEVLDDVNASIKDVNHKCKLTQNKIDKFEICPLCGQPIQSHREK